MFFGRLVGLIRLKKAKHREEWALTTFESPLAFDCIFYGTSVGRCGKNASVFQNIDYLIK